MQTRNSKLNNSINKDSLKGKCLNFLDRLTNSKIPCDAFLHPVEWRRLKIYNYPEMIKKPMDIGTVRKNVERKKYKKARDFLLDVMLIWSNCKTFNTEGSVCKK